MNTLVEKIKSLGFSDYACYKENNRQIVLLFMGYNYYKETNKENFSFSPYYLASNSSYFKTKELIEYIKSGGNMATMLNHTCYDPYLKKAGAKRGKNNLFYIEGLGSLYCVQIIETDILIEERILKGIDCLNCQNCIKACPTNSIREDKCNFDTCLRKEIDKVGENLLPFTQLLGCDICQKVCPLNQVNIEEKTYPMFNKAKILQGEVKDLAPLIGSNMARKKRLIFQSISILAKNKEKEYIEEIKPYINDENLGNITVKALKKINNV